MTWRWLMVLPLIAAACAAETRRVGPGQRYRTPCEAIRAAAAGDVIEIDAAGSYTGDVCAFYPKQLTLRGVNGRPRIDAGGRTAQGKAIWVIGGGEVTVENIEFTGAQCADRNGAGIRFEGRRLTVRDCVFRNNENGVLSGNDPSSALLIEYSEFDSNGYGDGYSHNVYVGRIAEFTMRFCWSHSAKEGHLVKSRAAVTNLLYNYLDTGRGTASYEADFPEPGTVLLLGNVIVQRPSSHNSIVVSVGQEAAPQPDAVLRLIHNTIINLGPPQATLVFGGRGAPGAAVFRNNVFFGDARITNAAFRPGAGNFHLPLSGVTDLAGLDFRPRGRTQTAVPLAQNETPAAQYLHPACGARRPMATTPGALESGAPPEPSPEAPARCRAPLR
ncbi:MAG: right-handed parallel beta-helix repeat-containing protein [Acidobacteriota bacterium]